ncbi:uncharacterized protein LOC110814539 isoform X2 [Carica papaya]|uniref:uncharacterized protein LOC110814539 isoform X2 n=1 Tax=Carica papaya TaxID=3649 RepID=UPI000B8CB1FF|nr:uncharacterized protein LOC110814539 isoform X2 [Carica papaya]
MAPRTVQLRRLFSLLARNQPRPSLLKDTSPQVLPSANPFFSGDYLYRRWIQTQTKPTSQTNEDLEDHEAGSLKPTGETANSISQTDSSEHNAVNHRVLSKMKTSSRHDLLMVFTCKVCDTRSIKSACRESYEKGVVVARCPGCNNLHLIADRLGWFGEPGSIEDFLAARGEEVTKGSLETLNLTLEDLAGKKTMKDCD